MRLSEYKTTVNNAVWKKLHKHYLENEQLIRCDYCKYHRKENWSRKPKRSWKWKSRRRNQFRSISYLG